MRKFVMPFAALVPLFCGVPIAAQDVPPPIPSVPAEPSPDMPAPQMNAEQKAQFDNWSAEQQVVYGNWPGDVQEYYWSLPEPRQDMFWKLSDNDRAALTSMPPEARADAWQLVEQRMSEQKAESPDVERPEPR